MPNHRLLPGLVPRTQPRHGVQLAGVVVGEGVEAVSLPTVGHLLRHSFLSAVFPVAGGEGVAADEAGMLPAVVEAAAVVVAVLAPVPMLVLALVLVLVLVPPQMQLRLRQRLLPTTCLRPAVDVAAAVVLVLGVVLVAGAAPGGLLVEMKVAATAVRRSQHRLALVAACVGDEVELLPLVEVGAAVVAVEVEHKYITCLQLPLLIPLFKKRILHMHYFGKHAASS